MDADEIKQMLTDIPARSFTPKLADHKTILCSDVEEAGGDLAEVEPWVKGGGGRKCTVDPSEGRTILGDGMASSNGPPLVSYFVVPFDALD
jgi:hypothetical protein